MYRGRSEWCRRQLLSFQTNWSVVYKQVEPLRISEALAISWCNISAKDENKHELSSGTTYGDVR